MDKKRILVIGGSHMSRTAGYMSKDTINLEEPGFVASAAASSNLLGRLQRHGPGPDNVIVMDLLSNSAFCGSDSCGVPLPPVGGGGGWYLPCAWLTRSLTAVNDQKSTPGNVTNHRRCSGGCIRAHRPES
jgi:hypothetical protein